MTRSRPAVEVLSGSAPEARRGIEGDFDLLLDRPDAIATRTWTCPGLVVVLGVSRDPGLEVDAAECERRGAAVLRRASGGGTVVVGDGTLQYAFAIAHDAGTEPPPLERVKQDCNACVAAALAEAGILTPLASDASGDLVAKGRKVGGLALRRTRHATLLHGTLLLDADLAAVSALLRHPAREPAWRRGRAHAEFLANLGPLDAVRFGEALRAAAPTSLARHRS